MSEIPGPSPLTDWQSTVASFMQAQIPCLYIQTVEEKRVLNVLYDVVKHLARISCGQRKVLLWSEVSLQEKVLFVDDLSKAEELRLPKQLEHKSFIEILDQFKAFDAGSPSKLDRHSAKTLVICDPEETLSEPVKRRALKEAVEAVRGTRKTIILLGKPITLAKELAADIVIIPFALPTAQELTALTEQYISFYKTVEEYKKFNFDEACVSPFARACSGITTNEAKALIWLAVVKFMAFDERAVLLALQEKARIVRRSNVLEVLEARGNLSNVGGLENVKKYISEITPLIQNPQAAHDYGAKLPPGILLLGIPGTGKSLFVQQLGAAWNMPILKLEMGRIFGSLLGESEGKLFEAFATAEAARPCILMIDELEKAVGGDSSDGGTTLRIKGAFLTWLQNKPDDIFVAATANDLRRLATFPELIRRFDQAFFVDLPDLRTRIEILAIHLKASGHAMTSEQLLPVGKITRGYTGDELAKAVQKALRCALGDKKAHPSPEDLVSALKLFVPQSLSMKEQITYLRSWAKEGRAMPAGRTIEHDDDDEADYNHRGLPDFSEIPNGM